MLIGHFAVGFASKKVAPRTNIAILLAAPPLLDLALLLAVYIGDRFSSPPSSVAEIAWGGIVAEAILIPLGMVV